MERVALAPRQRRWLLIAALALTVLAGAAVPSISENSEPLTTVTSSRAQALTDDVDIATPVDEVLTSATTLLPTVTTAPSGTPRPVVTTTKPRPSSTNGINEQGLYIRSLDGSLRHIAHPLQGGRYSSSWTPDSKSLYVARTYAGDQWSLSRYGMDGTSDELAAPVWYEPIAVSDSGDYLLRNRGSLNGDVLNLRTGETLALDTFLFTWLPGADVLMDTKGNTLKMDGSAGPHIDLPDGFWGHDVFISSDTKRFVGTQENKIVWFDHGGDLRTVTVNGNINTYQGCAFVPDGSRVACPVHGTGTSTAAWVIEVDLASGLMRTIQKAWAVAYSPSGQLTYSEEADAGFPYVQRLMMETPNGPVELLAAGRLGSLSATPHYFSWSPDGKYLAIDIMGYGQ